jgi:hypothetical protein|nr:MAG TPA: hypothetical protein [Caudoviricetes sp.]
MSFYPATITLDFDIQASSREEAETILQKMLDNDAFRPNQFEYPEIGDEISYADSGVIERQE